MTKNKTAREEFLRCFDKTTEALAQLDGLEGCDTMILVPLLVEFYKAATPFAQAMRPKLRVRVAKGEFSTMQEAVLNRFRETGSVMIYEGYRKFIRTADSLERRGLIKRNLKVFGDHAQYELTDQGRKVLDKQHA